MKKSVCYKTRSEQNKVNCEKKPHFVLLKLVTKQEARVLGNTHYHHIVPRECLRDTDKLPHHQYQLYMCYCSRKSHKDLKHVQDSAHTLQQKEGFTKALLM